MRLVCLAGAASLVAAGAAQAQFWAEVGDAPETMPGQLTTGSGPLTRITGNIVAGGNDFVDMYCIMITDTAAFRASTRNAGTTMSDTQLFLFRGTNPGFGNGVTMDDDDPAGGSLLSVITGAFVPGPGLYTIAVSGYNTDPTTAGGALIWNNTPFAVERAPDGPGAPGPLGAWIHDTFAPTGAYQIDLQGCTYCVPAPGSLGLLGLAGLVGLRRRR